MVTDGWSLDRELLALILEVLDKHRVTWLGAHVPKGDRRKIGDPIRFPRPHDPPPAKPPMVSAAEAAAFFAGR